MDKRSYLTLWTGSIWRWALELIYANTFNGDQAEQFAWEPADVYEFITAKRIKQRPFPVMWLHCIAFTSITQLAGSDLSHFTMPVIGSL